MGEFREQAGREVADYFNRPYELIKQADETNYCVYDAELQNIILGLPYAVSQRERVLQLTDVLESIASWEDCMLRSDDLKGDALEAFSLGSSKAFEQQAKMAQAALLAEPERENNTRHD